MRKSIIAIIVLGLLPITSAPADAKVCHTVITGYKKSLHKAGPTIVAKTKRVCR